MSPDLNPIEHLWKELKLADGRRQSSNLKELEPFAQEEGVKLPVEKCKNLIQSYRLQLLPPKAVLQNIMFRVPIFFYYSSNISSCKSKITFFFVLFF